MLYLVYIGRDGFAADAHALAVDEIAVLPEGQPTHHHPLLRRHHCVSTTQRYFLALPHIRAMRQGMD